MKCKTGKDYSYPNEYRRVSIHWFILTWLQGLGRLKQQKQHEVEAGINYTPQNKPRALGAMLEVIYQTRDTVFHRDIQTARRELKIRHAAEYF